MLRISIFTILLLTGCDKGPVNPSAAAPIQQATPIQQIESPLQNSAEGVAKAKAHDLEQKRLMAEPF